MQLERYNGLQINYQRQFIHKIEVKNMVLAGGVVPRETTQKTFKAPNNQANEYKYWKNP